MASIRQRKPHFKSRAGCLSCKKRHIKCGEEHPSCQNCLDRENKCTYGSTASRILVSSLQSTPLNSDTDDDYTSHVTSNTKDPLPCKPDSPNHKRITRMEELQLLFHYMNETVKTISTDSDIDVWTKAVPEEASQHDFLMDGILALSAHHFASLHIIVRWRYVEHASHYQASALQKYTDALHNVSKSNSQAIFAYAITTTILALAFTTMHNDIAGENPVDDLASSFKLLRGVGLVDRVSGTHLREGPFRVLWNRKPTEDAQTQLWPGVEHAMSELLQQIKGATEQELSARRQMYLSSIGSLDLIFKRLESSNIARDIIAWPAMVEMELLNHLRNGDPIAQLLFLHYGVLLLRPHDRWWGRGFGLRLIEHFAASLCAANVNFNSSIRWARECAAITIHNI